MPIQIVAAHDCTTQNVDHLPPGELAAGYTTGHDIAWTTPQWHAHPGAIRICQDYAATDRTADVLDVESGAATYSDCPGWATDAMANWDADTRPGQRKPAIYASANNITAVVDALVAGGVTSGVGLWVADWNWTEAQAVKDVQDAAGPFPIIGVQFADPGPYDDDVFDAAWVADVSGLPKPPAGGPRRHTATGLESLAGVCERRGVALQRAIWETAVNESRGFGPEQRTYFDHGNMTQHMPLGMGYWLP